VPTTRQHLLNVSPAATNSGEPNVPRSLVPIIALMSMVGPFTLDTYLPSFPDIAAEFGVGLAAMAQTISVYLVAFAMATLAWGPLADSFGRRRIVIVSMFFYVITSLGCAFADNLAHLLVLRLLQGVAASGGIVIGRAVVRDVYDGPRARSAMAQVMLVFALAPAVAPIVGGWLHDWLGWRSVFHFLALYGLVTMLLVLRILPETHPHHLRQSIHPRAIAGNYVMALGTGRFLSLVLTFCMMFGGLFLYIVGSPAIIFDHLGLAANHFAVQFVPMTAGIMGGSWLSGRLSVRIEPRRIINAAFALAGIALLLNLAQARWLAPNPVTVVGPVVIYAFAVSLSMPNLTVMALDCLPRNRGVASAVQAFVQMNINALVASLVMPFVASSLESFALAHGAFLLLSLLLWRFAF
jgi:DHA1 family bicyclomycin/chloramphenicol resistance-like MFS transporter